MRPLTACGPWSGRLLECLHHSSGRLFCCPKYISFGPWLPWPARREKSPARVQDEPTGSNGEVWHSPRIECARRACGCLSSAGRARPVYQRAGGARAPQGAGMLRAEGGRAVHHPMMRGALSRRPSDRRREQKEQRDTSRAASFLALLGGLSLPRALHSLKRVSFLAP